MKPENIAAIVLASGKSERFGEDDKLLAEFAGKPLAAYVAEAVRQTGFANCLAVIPSGAGDRIALFQEYGFGIIYNPAPEHGQGVSLALGVQAAAQLSVEGALIVLADMPLVTSALLYNVCESIEDAPAAVSIADERRTPPVLFRRDLFTQLTNLDGNVGGKNILNTLENITEVPVSVDESVDIDTLEDLQKFGG